VTYIVLKVGFLASRAAGLPMPDLSALIPEDLREIKESLVDLFGVSFEELSKTAQVISIAFCLFFI
jgi:hypothetical protein